MLRIVRSGIGVGTNITTKTKKSTELESGRGTARKRERERMRIRRGVVVVVMGRKGGKEIIRRKRIAEERGEKMRRVIYPTNCQMER